jgi:cytochrome c
MDSWEWNKIAGAVLGTLLFVVILKLASEAIFEVPPPAKPGYVVEGVQEAAGTNSASGQPAEEPLPDFGTVLAAASVSSGQQISQRCEQCHDLSKGGPNKIGPDLWGLVGRARATHAGFDYSSAMMTSHAAWTYEALYRYLKSPQAVVPGTKMSFAGLRSSQDRIDLIAYLRTLSDSPEPIPPPAAKTAPAPLGGKPAAAPAATPAQPAAPKKI